MLTPTEEVALARHLFQLKNHGHVNLDGSVVPHPCKDPEGQKVVAKVFRERLPLFLDNMPAALAEFARLAKAAGLSVQVAHT